MLSSLVYLFFTFVIILLGMAFFTLIERKCLGYFQLRKGPNKVRIIGLAQPFADALKLFTKELRKPNFSNIYPFFVAPGFRLFLAIFLWNLYPSITPRYYIFLGVIIFICVSSLNVYPIICSGWSSNSKYSLLGALRGIAQTISYEVRIALVLMRCLYLYFCIDISYIYQNHFFYVRIIIFVLFIVWFITCLAETNRTPFDLSEGESELVSGFNTEYRGGTFALIFIAEYLNIIIIRLFSSLFFFIPPIYILKDFLFPFIISFFCFSYIWIRATFPRIRYDRLISITWKCFLPFSIVVLSIIYPIFVII